MAVSTKENLQRKINKNILTSFYGYDIKLCESLADVVINALFFSV